MLFADEKLFALNVFPACRRNVYFLSSGILEERALAVAGWPVLHLPEALGSEDLQVSRAPEGDSLKSRTWPQSGAVRFLVGVMSLAAPLQSYVYERTSYDSGTNQYSRPAVHIQPNFRRGSAWVSAQWRF
jgi:hypothetical protein